MNKLTGCGLLSILLFTVVYIGIQSIPEVHAGTNDKSLGEKVGSPKIPSFKEYLLPNEYPLTINGTNYSYDDFSKKKTTTLKVGETYEIKIIAADDGGGNDIKRISLYMNLSGGKREIYESNTYISYNNYGNPSIRNSEGIIQSVILNAVPDGFKQHITIDIKFAKEMAISDVIIQVVDEINYSAQLRAVQAIQVIKADTIEESKQEDKINIIEPTKTMPDNIPEWIKQRTKAWVNDSSSDVGFAQGLTGMINENILHIPDNRITAKNMSEIVFEVPQWVKNNARWWTEDLISDIEFVNAIQFLLDNDHIKLEN